MKNNKKVYLIGNAHIDPVWQWVWQEGFSEIKATWRSALDRMYEFPHYKFTSGCSSYYMWVEKSDPEMFKEIQKRVKEGRWCIVGGQFVQPDCNLPSGEAFARHSLVSQRYFKEKFGFYVKTGYNVDSFGHNGNMPLILKNSKMENYVFMRPNETEKSLPQSFFKWQSNDGSLVNTFRISHSYCLDMRENYLNILKTFKDVNEKTDLMAFYGIGNHGGGATIELLNWMKENLAEEYLYSTPDEFFENANHNELPILKDDLQFHAKGCYSAVSKIKSNNRRSENEIVASEKYSVLSGKLMNTPYPNTEIDRAWQNIMFNQFHDILGGCCIKDAYTDAEFSYGESLSISQRITNYALQQIAWNIDTTVASRPDKAGNIVTKKWDEWQDIGNTLVVFNPHDHEITATIPTRRFATIITDWEGNVIPLQRIRDCRTATLDKKGTHVTIFSTKIPAFGYKCFRCWWDKEWIQPQSEFKVTENSIENELVKITIDENTAELCSVYLKQSKTELLKDVGKTVFIDETEWDTWAHKAVEFKNIAEKAEKISIKLTENGSVKATICTEQKIGNSKIIRNYSLIKNDVRVYVKTRVEFLNKHRMLKFIYPCAITEPKAFGEIPFGFKEQPTNGSEQPMLSWCTIKDDKGGLVIANDSKYSFDADGNELSLTVLRSPLFCDHVGVNRMYEGAEYTDQGIHDFEYVIFPFVSFSDCKKKADELNTKPICFQETFHKGCLKTEYSALEISAENVTVTAIKNSEDNVGTVIRFEELEGKDTEFSVRFFENTFTLKIGHNAVKTVIVDGLGNVKETDFIED